MTDPAAYPAIPEVIWAYYEKILDRKLEHPLVKAIKTQGEGRTWQSINDLFSITAKNTGLVSDKLLTELGFKENNFDNNHLQSIFGVMRAINMLHTLGFSEIKPLPAKKKTRECDLRAEHNSQRFAIEVMRSSEAAYRFPDHEDPVHDLPTYVVRRYQEKHTQLTATMKAHNCYKALLVVVMDSPPAKQLTESGEWDGIAKNIFENMKNPPDIHILLFTGLRDAKTDTDEYAVYPPFDC